MKKKMLRLAFNAHGNEMGALVPLCLGALLAGFLRVSRPVRFFSKLPRAIGVDGVRLGHHELRARFERALLPALDGHVATRLARFRRGTGSVQSLALLFIHHGCLFTQHNTLSLNLRFDRGKFVRFIGCER